MILQDIRYYNMRRVQRNLGVLMPMEKHTLCLAAYKAASSDSLLAGEPLFFFCPLDGMQFTYSILLLLRFHSGICYNETSKIIAAEGWRFRWPKA